MRAWDGNLTPVNIVAQKEPQERKNKTEPSPHSAFRIPEDLQNQIGWFKISTRLFFPPKSKTRRTGAVSKPEMDPERRKKANPTAETNFTLLTSTAYRVFVFNFSYFCLFTHFSVSLICLLFPTV